MRAIVSEVGAGSNRPRRPLWGIQFRRLVSPASRNFRSSVTCLNGPGVFVHYAVDEELDLIRRDDYS